MNKRQAVSKAQSVADETGETLVVLVDPITRKARIARPSDLTAAELAGRITVVAQSVPGRIASAAELLAEALRVAR